MSNSITLQLPFKGSWFVFWGGDTKTENYHHGDSAEKFALDMVVLDKNGKTHSGSGEKNEDYYAYGRAILAPADGEVIEAVDGLRDNIPQKTTNDYAYGGNYVMIKHADDIYSASQHLRRGSVQVKAGQRVKAGQQLGECGNSGNSSEPHLHFHLMDSDVLSVYDKQYNRKPKAKGIKAYFKATVSRDNKSQYKKRYAPVRGDIISNTE